jgi:hypothetical protein
MYERVYSYFGANGIPNTLRCEDGLKRKVSDRRAGVESEDTEWVVAAAF